MKYNIFYLYPFLRNSPI